VTDRDQLTAIPTAVTLGGTHPRPVHAWAGPWPADDRWWLGPGSSAEAEAEAGAELYPAARARVQVLVGGKGSQTALLLAYHKGSWTVQAHYD
jgi:protein ImuB